MVTKERKASTKKTVVGYVVSDKSDKTITVQAQKRFKHKLLGKYLTKKFKFSAHDQNNDAHIGDKVKVIEISRPLSKTKRWTLKEIVEKAQ